MLGHNSKRFIIRIDFINYYIDIVIIIIIVVSNKDKDIR